ncbi:MAG: Fic family protein [Coriobacteriaceae bacterium]|nr:Fic family protein [Coriobacteriaceae bacterium]
MSVRALLSKAGVVEIHRETVSRFGGSRDIRDEGMLDASLAQPWQAFEGRELYPGDIAKVCRLSYGIITNHPFVDGNKRTGAPCSAPVSGCADIGSPLRRTSFWMPCSAWRKGRWALKSPSTGRG